MTIFQASSTWSRRMNCEASPLITSSSSVS